MQGPGTWIVNFAFYKDIVRARSFSVDFTAVLDNAFDHPQFVVGLGTAGFMDLTDYLINGVAANGNTTVIDADSVGSIEGFSVGRVVRLRDSVAILGTLPQEIRDEAQLEESSPSRRRPISTASAA